MGPGTVIGERFAIESLHRTGGMADVFRATDRRTGQPVAVKLLRSVSGELAERFEREALILATLDHPTIVSYVHHGFTAAQQRYLVMPWMDGEDLAARLRRADLTIGTATRLVARIAEGLSIAHMAGVIHRDVKPANVLLRDNKTATPVLIDFGIASLVGATTIADDPRITLGTPGYMAPEQARTGRTADSRADIYALGCILFRCLSGRAVFTGDSPVAVMTKTILEPAPRLSELRANIPDRLDALVAAMLEKRPEDRPQTAGEVSAALGEFAADNAVTRARRAPSIPAISRGEQRFIAMVMARADRVSANQVREEVARFGGECAQLADGVLAITVEHATTAATDESARAARCALAVRELLPRAAVALATGRGEVDVRVPAGEVIDRAAELLELPTGAGVRIDEVTAGLIEGLLEVGADDAGQLLIGPTALGDDVRTLLGAPTPFVGRIRELGFLDALLEETIAESTANAVLVTADAGIGKSRLRHEFVKRLRRGDRAIEIWRGSGDPMRAGAGFAMLAPIVSGAAGLADGDDDERRNAKLRQRLMERLEGDDLPRVAMFLREIAGLPASDTGDVALSSARRDPIVMGDQMRRAWLDWLDAELRQSPVVLVLEDLHWGDRPSIEFIDSALRSLADRPLMVLAFARPEVHDAFPDLWVERNLTEIPLRELSRKASRRLVVRVLGADLDDDTVDAIVERAAGNAFYLEELIRAVASGARELQLPDTVLAMAQARLGALGADARRVLRAASVYGRPFTRRDAEALLGGVGRAHGVEDHLEELAELEVLALRRGDEPTYDFRHAFLREAAYEMLTEDDRVAGHRKAGAHLERIEGSDPVELAEHFERGEVTDRARHWYHRAAEHALATNDFLAVLSNAERAVRCGIAGAELGQLRALSAEAHRWLGNHRDSARDGHAAMQLLPRTDPGWFRAAGLVANAAGNTGDTDRLVAIGNALCGLTPRDDLVGPYIMALARASDRLMLSGRFEFADNLTARLEEIAGHPAAGEPTTAAWLDRVRGFRALFSGDPAGFTLSMQRSANAFEVGGDLRNACLQRGNAGFGFVQVGMYRPAEALLRDVVDTARRLGLHNVITSAQVDLGHALALLGEHDEAIALLDDVARMCVSQGNPRIEASARTYLAIAHADRGALDCALAEAERACRAGASTPPVQATALAVHARVLCAAGRRESALEAATRAHALLESLGSTFEGDSLVRLAYAEALDACGDRPRAAGAVAEAMRHLADRAARIAEPEFRTSFMTNDPANAALVALSELWR